MDLNLVAYYVASWLFVSAFTSFALARFIRGGNGPRDDTDAAQSAPNPKVVSYLHHPRRKAMPDTGVSTSDLQRTAAPRRRAV